MQRTFIAIAIRTIYAALEAPVEMNYYKRMYNIDRVLKKSAYNRLYTVVLIFIVPLCIRHCVVKLWRDCFSRPKLFIDRINGASLSEPQTYVNTLAEVELSGVNTSLQAWL